MYGLSEDIQPGISDTLTNLFRDDAGEASASGGRAQKRRKLGHDTNDSLQSMNVFDAEKSVLLAEMVLDLVSLLLRIDHCAAH
jgi:hypothetical protein